MAAGRSSKSGPTSLRTTQASAGARRAVAGLALATLAGLSWVAAAGANDVATGLPAVDLTSPLERGLVEGLLELRRGDLDTAHDRITSLVERQPDFRLAHLVRGDLWLAQATGLSRFGHGLPQDERVADLLFEAQARWSRYRKSPPARTLPHGLLKVPQGSPSALAVDLLNNRLFVFERLGGQLVKTRDFYVSIGRNGSEKQAEGDDRTPVGYYLVSGFLDGESLPDMYGPGAFPLNYPNGWDRLHGRTGSGIWIHGTESTTYSRPPRSSRGCVTLSNEDFRSLQETVEIQGTPVLVASGFEWVPAAAAEQQGSRLESRLEEWRRAWESRDTQRYLGFYSDSFRTQGMDREAFGAYKRRVNRGKKFIRVRLDDVGIYAYPGEADVVVVDFVQHYQSDTFKRSSRKHQYWRREPAGWRIVFEEKV